MAHFMVQCGVHEGQGRAAVNYHSGQKVCFKTFMVCKRDKNNTGVILRGHQSTKAGENCLSWALAWLLAQCCNNHMDQHFISEIE